MDTEINELSKILDDILVDSSNKTIVDSMSVINHVLDMKNIIMKIRHNMNEFEAELKPIKKAIAVN